MSADPIRARLDEMPCTDAEEALRAVLDLCDRADEMDKLTGWTRVELIRWSIARHLGVTDDD